MNNPYIPQIGDRLVRRKGILEHHGIYIGYYNGQHIVAENNPPHGVRYVTYEGFLDGNNLVRVNRFTGTELQRKQIIPFIESKIGTQYNLMNYNCEHFASEIQNGKPASEQVQQVALIGIGIVVLAVVLSD